MCFRYHESASFTAISQLISKTTPLFLPKLLRAGPAFGLNNWAWEYFIWVYIWPWNNHFLFESLISDILSHWNEEIIYSVCDHIQLDSSPEKQRSKRKLYWYITLEGNRDRHFTLRLSDNLCRDWKIHTRFAHQFATQI